MTPKKGCAYAFGLVLLTCCALATTATLLSVWPVTRVPAVDTRALLVDASAFPPGWYACFDAEQVPELEYGERESLHVGFAHAGLEPYTVGASHTVYRYRNELDATILYTLEFTGRGFPKSNMITPWMVPEEWSYHSTAADRFTFACGEFDFVGPKWTCKAVAQYDEYVSVFRSELSPDYMTLEELERVLVAIDERMSFYLHQSVH